MAKVTSKLQVTLPKRIAERHGIAPGDSIEFRSAGDIVQIVPAKTLRSSMLSTEERLRLFDESTARQRRRLAGLSMSDSSQGKRDWRREDLYDRGSSD